MYIIRPINTGDYDALNNIAVESGIGFTSLPVNETLLRKKISRAESAFSEQVVQPGNQSYLLLWKIPPQALWWAPLVLRPL